MSQPFEAHTGDMQTRGQEIDTTQLSFRDQIKLVYNTIDEMLQSNYSSDEAFVIANEIKGYRPDLEALATMLENYGIYSVESAKAIQGTQDSIINGVRRGGGY